MPDTCQNIIKEYEEFAYVVSHDLKGAIRQLQSFSELFADSFECDLTEKQQTYKDIIDEISENTTKILEALTKYSRLNSQEWAFSETDLNEVVSEILKNNDEKIKELKAIITTNNLPIVTGNKTLLTDLFSCLLDNALKFQEKGKTPKINIGLDNSNGKEVIYIQDNGTGFDPEKIEQAFTILRTLEKNDGLGVGLSFAKKIVQKHGGSICIDTKPGNGTRVSFYFGCN